MNLRWLLRLHRLAKNPPSPGRVALIVGVVVLCGALVAVETWIGWPEALTIEPIRR